MDIKQCNAAAGNDHDIIYKTICVTEKVYVQNRYNAKMCRDC